MSATTVSCPHCGKPIAVEEVLKHQVEQEILAVEQKKHEEELQTMRTRTLKEAKDLAVHEFEMKMKNTEEENKEIKDQKDKLQKEFLDLSKQMRTMLREQDEFKIEMEKQQFAQIEEERKNARQQAEKQTAQEYQRKIAEMQKQLSDAVKAKDELSRKLEQGSQQTQGEVVELQLEETLRTSFPTDIIEPVGKGVNGADIRQIVKSPGGVTCGVILWESKQTKRFDEKWIPKLKQDALNEKADLPAIVSASLPDGATGLQLKDGVWISSFQLVLPLATLLRKILIDVARQKFTNEQKTGKADLVYEYVTGHEFRQQIEAVVEVYTEMQQQILKERIAFEKSWKQREGQLQRLFTSTSGIYGSLQGRAGNNAIPQIKGLELAEIGDGT